jgi:O-antigen ligase/tetratricopeptide (TPR) repeat protein
VLHWLSPQISNLLPLWTGSSLDAWQTLSLSPEETRAGLGLLVAYALLALVVTQRVGGVQDIERLLRWLTLATVLMAMFGLVQYLASNGRYFWFYQHPFTDTTSSVRGAFSNRNHFAHFMGLGLGPLLWWLQKGMPNRSSHQQASWSSRRGAHHLNPRRAWRVGLGWILLAMTLFALLMSFSRGGILAVLVAGGVYVAIAFRAGLLSKRFAWSLAGVALLVAASLMVHGYRSVADRLDDLTSASLEELDQQQGRRKIWTAVAAAFTDFPLVGAGVGTHRALYPRYLEQYSPTDYTHAENGYLQLAEETGLAGLVLLSAIFVFCVSWCWRAAGQRVDRRQRRHLACLAAIAASLVMSAAHSCADFVWYVPSCVAVVAVLVPCALHLARQASRTSPVAESSLPRYAWLGGAVALAALGVMAIQERIGPALAQPYWDHYHIAHRGLTDPRRAADLMLADFSAMVAHDPNDARSQLGLAEAHLRQFDLLQQQSDNSMSLTALRDAAHAWQGASPDELHAWLSRATGASKPHLDRALWHTRRALRLCPLHGQGYLYLAELAFLDSQQGLSPAACIDQARRVRPFDGGVLFKAGEEAALAGDIPTALVHWKQAFHAGPVIQSQLIDYAAARGFPLAFFTEHFEPDLNAYRRLHARYQPLTAPEPFAEFLKDYLAAAQQSAKTKRSAAAAEAWLEVHRLAMELDDPPRASTAARRAIKADPGHFQAHLVLGKQLLEQRQFEQAEPYLRWCQMRRAGDAGLRQLVEQATKGRIDAETQATGAARFDPLLTGSATEGIRK